jgi:DNA ligase-associated metallophosphoesterase
MEQTNVHKIINWQGVELWLHPEKLIIWPAQKTVILADWHFGKIGHFRKYGIALPKSSFKESLDKLSYILKEYQLDRILVLGDLFHSDYNLEIDYFKAWRNFNSNYKIDMIKGNHDILEEEEYLNCGIRNLGPEYKEEGLYFVHDPEDGDLTIPRMCGHLHPGVSLRGKGRQHLRLPCFWFSDTLAVLPAFGTFTGKSKIKPAKKDWIFIPAGNRVIEFDLNTGVQSIN